MVALFSSGIYTIYCRLSGATKRQMAHSDAEDLAIDSAEEDEVDPHENTDADYVVSCERRQYEGHLPCLSERVVHSRSILSPKDIEDIEGAVRTVLRCDFAACAALDSAAYACSRNKVLRYLREKHRVTASRLPQPTAERVHVSSTILLEFRWDPLQMAIVERPHQTHITVPGRKQEGSMRLNAGSQRQQLTS